MVGRKIGERLPKALRAVSESNRLNRGAARRK